ncbi:hypothetical protein PROFUN_15211 [Planoprotostelium fungivorum]|uniref:Uncharacterized protein n=1 Tax=Planoprotostelium fungivorum TaxID=1890364 RepID=A0A2P6MX11_9EUKA|nr:hypothetical protein PROFUN_15211 [Planoprotostelium fungivorum]
MPKKTTTTLCVGSETQKTLVLRLKNQKRGNKTIFSWLGLEEERHQIHCNAHRQVELYSKLHQKYPAMMISGMTVQAFKDPNCVDVDPDAKEVGILQKELKMMSQKLVEENHLDFYFVRKEWATITDPSPREKEVCERAIAMRMNKSK